MKKYRRVGLEVEAVEYLPFKKITVEGFRHIISKVQDLATMEEIPTVLGGEVRIDGNAHPVQIGDYLVRYPDGKIRVKKPDEFWADFTEIDEEQPPRRGDPQS